MRAIGLLIVPVALGMFSSTLHAEEAYQLVRVWPEAPQGWHFFNLNGVAVDKSGNVYIADSGNYRVKKFDSEGRFITQWGSPGQGNGQFNTIGSIKVDGSGIVYVLDTDYGKWEHSRIQKFTAYGQFLGRLERRAPDADQIKYPVDLATDDERNVLVLGVDYNPKQNRTYGVRIEKYSPKGEFLSQWGAEAGSGDGQLQRPNAIAVDTEGNVYITEMATNSRVQKFDSSGKFLTKWGSLWVGGGEGDGVFRGGARSIAIDETGDIYVLDFNSVQKFTSEGEFLVRWKTGGAQACRLAIDSHSNLYVTDMNSHLTTKLNSKGNVISQWGCAGTGDGRLAEPGSIAVDPSGHLVVADTDNSRIQRFTSEGKFISTWGGENWPEVWDLATDAFGNLYCCADTNEVQKYNREGKLIGRWGSSGRGDGQFGSTLAIAVAPSGNVYVADCDNGCVQKFTDEGKFLAKWGTAGTGDGQFIEPFFIAVDDSGNVWVGDQLGRETHRMQKFDADGRFLAKWTKKVMRPYPINYKGAMAVDSSGNSYYAFESRIEKYNAEGDLISTYGREGFSKDKLGKVWAVCVDKAGCLYVTGPADPCASSLNANGSIRKFDADGKLVSRWTAESTEGKEQYPNGPITVDGAGNIYASRWGGPWVTKLTSEGRPVTKFRIAAPREGRFGILGGVAADRSGRVYAVDSVDADWGIPSIKQFDPNGRFLTLWEVPEEAKDKFKYPAFIAVDGSGNMYVTDKSSHCVHKLDAQGKYIKSWGDKGTGDGQFDTPEGIAADGSGHVYVCDRQNSRLQKFDSDGKVLAKWGKEGSGDGEFHFPAAVAVDQEGNVFVADSDNHRVQKFTAEGKFLTKWGGFGEAPGQFNVPLGIAVDQEGNVYVSDSHNHRIQKFAPAAPIDLSGKWSGFESGSDWGWVTIQGNRGTYTDTYGPEPGKLEFHRIGPNAYSGTWGESDKRHGTMSFTVSDDGNKITGTYKADKDVEIDPQYRRGVIYWVRQ
jgi:DNA-binding beta-propeller fold protein YncE